MMVVRGLFERGRRSPANDPPVLQVKSWLLNSVPYARQQCAHVNALEDRMESIHPGTGLVARHPRRGAHPVAKWRWASPTSVARFTLAHRPASQTSRHSKR
jgi:hypothetical protein